MDLSTEGPVEGPASDERIHNDYEMGDVERPGFVRACANGLPARSGSTTSPRNCT